MIVIERAAASASLAAMKKSAPRGSPKGLPEVEVEAGRDGLTVRWATPDVAVEYRRSGRFPDCRVALPGDAFADFKGRREMVSLEPGNNGGTLARWDDAGVPQVREYPPAESLPPHHPTPERMTAQPEGFPEGFRDAVPLAGEPGRYDLHRLQLRGDSGELIATDGRALLIQGGFDFPWPGDLLVSATRIFGCPGWAEADEVSLGVTDSHLCVRAGEWTVWLALDAGGRFPPVEGVVPRESAGDARCRISDADARFLAAALPMLPGKGGPVTVSLGDGVKVRAAQDGGRVTELTLTDSTAEGPAVTAACDRSHLTTMLSLGFRSFSASKPGSPLACREADRTYVWMPLDPALALDGRDAVRVSSDTPPVTQNTTPTRERHVNARGNNIDNGPAGKPGVAGGRQADPRSPLEEAEALRAELREAYGRAVRLVGVIKRQRRQSKLVKSTLESLKQLPSIE